MTTLLTEILGDAFSESPRQRAAWRDYFNLYEGDQLTARQKQILKALNLSQETANLVAPSINAIVGNEIAERVPWRLNPNSLQYNNELAAFGQITSDAMVAGGALGARTRAHKNQLVSGIGWLHAHIDDGPMSPFMRWKSKPIWDVFWDVRGTGTQLDAELTGARWVLYREFFELDTIMSMFNLTPDDERVQRLKTWANDDFNDALPAYLREGGHAPQSPSETHASWFCDTGRKRPAVVCAYVKSFERRQVVYWPSGRKELFNPANNEHAVASYEPSGDAQIKMMSMPVITRYYFAAGLLMAKDEMPELQGMFPMVPFVGMVKQTGEVYAMCKDANGPQARYNNALQTIVNGLDSVHIVLGSGAQDSALSDEEIIVKARSRSAVWKLGTAGDQALTNTLQFIRSEADRINQAQTDMITARGEIEFITGVNGSFMGQAAPSQRSGRMADQQASSTLRTKAEYTDHYLEASDQMYKISMALIAHKKGRSKMEVRLRHMFGTEGAVVELNTTGANSVRTLLQHASPTEALTGEAGGPAAQRTLLLNLMDRAPAQSPEAFNMMVMSVWENTGTPEGRAMAKGIRKLTGMEPAQGTKEWEEWKQAQDAQREAQDAQMQREIAKLEAETAKINAEARRAEAEAEAVQGREDNAANKEERKKREMVRETKEKIGAKRAELMAQGAPATQ